MALLLLALVYMAGRRGIAERRGREMEAMISRLEEAQETLKQSERALRSSEVQYRSLIEHAPFGVFRTGPKGKLIMANRALADTLGFDSPSDVDGLELGADLFENERDWVTLESSLRSRGGSPVVDARWRHRNGSVLSVRVGLRLVADPDGGTETLEGFVEDVTERQRLEEQLRQSQKMQAVGQLAGGIAHDFNNLLTVILGSCQLLLTDTMEDGARAELEEMQVAANRAATLTRQLLAFSKQQPLAPQVLDLNEAVESALKLLRRVVGEDVRLVTNLSSETGAVRVDPGQFQQVIMNLVVNARDAMSRGGTIEIRTEPASGDDEPLRLHPDATAASYALLSVADDGEGMDPSTLERVFEPFFTTKETGKGTGLGLATVYGIVAQSGGDIRAESEVGTGTTFRVFLPTADGAPEPTAGDVSSASPGRLGTADPAPSSEARSGHGATVPGVRGTDA